MNDEEELERIETPQESKSDRRASISNVNTPVHHSSSSAHSSRSEFDFIKRIRRRAIRQIKENSDRSSLITHHSSLSLGIGDDAAVIRQSTGRDMVLTADLLVEDIDFRRATMPASVLGYKALAVSLSDIAAMGARPRWALLSLGVPPEIWRSTFVDQFYEGFFALAEDFNVALIGGDVSRTPERIVVDSILLGETASGRALLRSGARPGDYIFVTGSLGGAAAGLRLLERGAENSMRAHEYEARLIEKLILRQQEPRPRVEWGTLLGERQIATAMIDISDGLSSDLAHLCEESGVGAKIEARRVPVNRAVARLCGRRALDPLMLALHGGEDFELLFTVSPRDISRLPRKIEGVRATYIGDVTNDARHVLISEGSRSWDLEPGGFEHFS